MRFTSYGFLTCGVRSGDLWVSPSSKTQDGYDPYVAKLILPQWVEGLDFPAKPWKVLGKIRLDPKDRVWTCEAPLTEVQARLLKEFNEKYQEQVEWEIGPNPYS